MMISFKTLMKIAISHSIGWIVGTSILSFFYNTSVWNACFAVNVSIWTMMYLVYTSIKENEKKQMTENLNAQKMPEKVKEKEKEVFDFFKK